MEILAAPVPRARLAALAAVGLGASIAPLDFAVNIAFPAITTAFDIETRAIRWVAVCYVLVYGSLMLAFGALGDRIGHLRVFRAGLLLAALAFTLCALAPTYPWLLAARMLQGVAVALTLSCAPALATGLFGEARRTWALSVFAGIGALAGLIAPLAGGAAVATLGWPGVYWMRVPVVLLAFLCVPLIARQLTLPAARGESRFDVTGMALLAASLALLLLAPAMLRTGALFWPALFWPVLPLAAGGALLLVVFALRERAAVTPLLPRAVLHDAGFVVPNLAAVVVQFTSFAVPLLLPYFLLRMQGWGALACGTLLATWAAGTLAASSLAPRLIARLGTRRAAFGGGVLAAAGLAAIAAWPQQPGLTIMVACLVAQGAGLGLFQLAYTDLVVAALPVTQRGVAGSLSMVTRTAGIVLGVSLLTWILETGEMAALARGAAGADAFMAGFTAAFQWAAALAAACFGLTALHRRIWFARGSVGDVGRRR